MSRRRVDSDETTARLWSYAAYAEAHPMSAADVHAWLLGLSGFNDYEGKLAQMQVCEDILEHADEDDLLDRDKAIVMSAILTLHEELNATPNHLRVHRRLDYYRSVARLGVDEYDPFPD